MRKVKLESVGELSPTEEGSSAHLGNVRSPPRGPSPSEEGSSAKVSSPPREETRGAREDADGSLTPVESPSRQPAPSLASTLSKLKDNAEKAAAQKAIMKAWRRTKKALLAEIKAGAREQQAELQIVALQDSVF